LHVALACAFNGTHKVVNGNRAQWVVRGS